MSKSKKVKSKSAPTIPATCPAPYDHLSITDIEIKVRELSTLSRESMREMYVVLEYLRTSNRFKENTLYKKATFWQYIEDNFTIREGTYRENTRAYIKFPEYAVEYGVGIVAKVDKLCGGKNVNKVINEIKKESLSHKKPISRAKMEDIIQRCRTTPRIEKISADWKAMYISEKAAHEKTITALKIAMSKVNELNDQVAKLKATAEKFVSIRGICEGAMENKIAGVDQVHVQ